MRISSLKYFYEVAELKSISKVSNELHISQPALSHQLLKLEKELGTKLLDRSNRGVELTTKGKVLYNYAKQILAIHKNLIEEIEEDTDITQDIKIDILSTHANFIMKLVAKDINKIFKNTNVNINNKRDTNDKSILLHNRADLVIGCNKIEDDDIVCEYIGSDKLVLVSKKHLLCKEKNNLDIALLDDSENSISNNIEKINDINICLKTDSLDIIKYYLENDNSGAIVPMISVENELKSGELELLCCNAYAVDYHLYISYKKDIDTSLKKKLKNFKKELENILHTEHRQIEI